VFTLPTQIVAYHMSVARGDRSGLSTQFEQDADGGLADRFKNPRSVPRS